MIKFFEKKTLNYLISFCILFENNLILTHNNYKKIMKQSTKLSLIACILVFASACSSGPKKTEETTTETPVAEAPAAEVTTTNGTGLANKGIGPIKSVTLDAEINQSMVADGQEIYQAKCTACHFPDKKHIGPAPKGILEKRSPEWVMNMILNPDVMTTQDPDGIALLKEYNGVPMANQNLTEVEARSILEYFRTLK